MINRVAERSPFIQETHENLKYASLLPTLGGLLLSWFGASYAVHFGSLTYSLFSVTVGAATLTCTPLVVIVAGLILFGLGVGAFLYLSNTKPKKNPSNLATELSLEQTINISDYELYFSKIQQILDECNVQSRELPREKWIDEVVGKKGYLKFPLNRIRELNSSVYVGKASDKRQYLLIKHGEEVFFLQQRYIHRPYFWAVSGFHNDFGTTDHGPIKDEHLQALKNAFIFS